MSVVDPVPFFADVAARHPRCFWLDGGGARPWSGRRSILGWLDDDDVSLTYDAARREVTRHAGATSEVVGDDVFAVLEDEMAGDGPDVHWVGYFGYACRPDLPASLLDRRDGMPDAVWMRTPHVQVVQHPERGSVSRRAQSALLNQRGRVTGSWMRGSAHRPTGSTPGAP